MRRYLFAFLAIPVIGIFAIAACNVVIDPFDIYRFVTIAHLNQAKPVRDSNGARIAISHEIMRGGYRALFIGNSRVQRGFPQTAPEIEGGALNAGMAGATALEAARAAALGRRVAGVDCMFVSLDFASFNTVGNKSGGYNESALPDGSRWRSWVETAFAYPTLVASVNTVSANAFGAQLAELSEAPTVETVPRTKFVKSGRLALAFYRGFEYDTERLKLIVRVIDLMTAQGIQAIVFFPPTHAWNEEAIWDGGKAETYLRFRRDALTALEPFRARPVHKACDASSGAVSSWDFSGFRLPARQAVPTAETRGATTPFTEAQHFDRTLGTAMLRMMIGAAPQSPWHGADLGERIDLPGLAANEAGMEARRQQWLDSPDGATLEELVKDWRRSDAPTPSSDRSFLTADDFAGL